MKKTVSTAMPPCFERWCKHFDDVFSKEKSLDTMLGNYWEKVPEKNLSQLAGNAVDV